MSHDLEQHPIFICGLPRSGTTLLKALLDGHPELVVDASESRFFMYFVPQAQKVSPRARPELALDILLFPKHRIFDPAGDHYKTYFSHISVDELKKTFLEKLRTTDQELRDYLTTSVLTFGEFSDQLRDETKYWVEKTIFNERYVDQIFEWWPNAKCIHIIRDPKDQFANFRRRDIRQNRPPTKIGAFCYTWGNSAQLALAHQQQYGDQRYLILHYEDLVADPESQIKRLIDYLDIENHPILYQPTKVGGKIPWSGNSSLDQKFSGISDASVGKWQESLSQRQLILLQLLVGKYMQEFGYWLETPAPHLGHLFETLTFRTLNTARKLRDRSRPA